MVNVCPTMTAYVQLDDPKPDLPISAAYMKLPSIINYTRRFTLNLSLRHQKLFGWQKVELYYFSTMLSQYLKFGYCNDNFEFFA